MKRRKPSKQERQSRMTLTLILSGCVFVVTLVTLLIIGAALLIVDRTGQLGKWMEHSSILSFFLIIAAISLVGGTLMALLLGTFPLRSVSEMTQGLHRLASGDYDVRIEPKGLMATIAPLRDMVESFNATASELAGTEMLRSDFINNFSHEFKTPIVSIAGFASLLRQGDLTRAEQLEYLDIIESESKRLADMATNVLNMTKVENQAILTDVSTFNLSEQPADLRAAAGAEVGKEKSGNESGSGGIHRLRQPGAAAAGVGKPAGQCHQVLPGMPDGGGFRLGDGK